MPLRAKQDFASGDETKNYCTHCARSDGSMQSYDEVLMGMAQFMVRTQGIELDVAKNMAVEMMKILPAWKR